MLRVTRVLVTALAVVVASATAARAHTISIGYENAGVGSVNFWFGTYHTLAEAPSHEGSFRLEGISGTVFGPVVTAFDLIATSQPAGLIDGTTNFYADTANGLTPTNTLVGLPVLTWQGVNFSGLAPGTYQFSYIPIAFPTAKWAPWNDAIETNTLVLTGGVVGCGDPGQPPCPSGGVPEPGSMILLGSGLVGLARYARRKK
jgi:hypothetical protein